MILVLADAADVGATWLQSALRPAMAVPVALLTPARLVYAPAIAQWLSTDGGTSRLTLGDGTKLDLAAVTGVVNRMTAAPDKHFAHAAPADRDYAISELHAFLLGWLAALDCPLLNPPAPESLAGPWHSPICALEFASIVGLGRSDMTVSTDRPLPRDAPAPDDAVHFIVDGQVIGPLLPPPVRDAMIHFALLWGARLMQIETSVAHGVHVFRSASSLVDFQRGGASLVRAMARALGA